MSNFEFALMLAGSFAAGLVIGFLYFYGLWLTIQRLPSSKRPAILALGSFFGRTAAAVVVMYFLVRGGYWQNGVAYVAGVIVMRVLLVRWISFRTPANETNGEK